MEKKSVIKTLNRVLAILIVIATITLVILLITLNKTKKERLNENLETYSLVQYDNDNNVIATYPSVVIISQNDNLTLIYDTVNNKNIRIIGGRLDFTKLEDE